MDKAKYKALYIFICKGDQKITCLYTSIKFNITVSDAT